VLKQTRKQVDYNSQIDVDAHHSSHLYIAVYLVDIHFDAQLETVKVSVRTTKSLYD